MKLKYILFCLIILVLAAGCAKPPLEEMESAREAVFRAENDPDAVLYGGSSLARARDALRRMQVEADSKRYDAAKTAAAEAIAAAERAQAEGKAGIARIKKESDSVLAGLKSAIDETERSLNNANYNNLNLDYNQLRSDLATAKDAAERAEIDNLMGRYQESLDSGRVARSIISGINEKIASATVRSKS
jgi:hypothetical protein